MTQTLTAQDAFRAAYDNRYTWDKDFPGFTADVTFTHGEESHSGQVTIKPDMSFEVTGIEDEAAKKEIEGQLWEMTIHRVRRTFEESHGKNSFEFGEKDANGAQEIKVTGASMGNSYKIKNDTVTFVNRKIRNVIVNINTFETLDTDEGYLSLGYDSVYFDAETKEPQGGTTLFRDSFEKIDGYYVLTKREITSKENDEVVGEKVFTFSNIKF
ncbi:DUF3386 domain-containing protein [[Limnothrix rosea] IAM M-220]|uniref:DUF3386 domain-containing protein n=1 Tax=[Limnothrix rosea] IAM M-220 TaxID=454133 RepID=UPI00095AACEC|nr:DUF3386 domain-containing protein [[Limnothrix rosea] IAM M-220]OKH18758.1 hypothetical protein NIES208_04685 [[Limnothrix rosea] IAM M-220]